MRQDFFNPSDYEVCSRIFAMPPNKMTSQIIFLFPAYCTPMFINSDSEFSLGVTFIIEKFTFPSIQITAQFVDNISCYQPRSGQVLGYCRFSSSSLHVLLLWCGKLIFLPFKVRNTLSWLLGVFFLSILLYKRKSLLQTLHHSTRVSSVINEWLLRIESLFLSK